MWRTGLWQGGKLVASLFGALLLAALLASVSHHAHGFWPALGAFSQHAIDMLRGGFGDSSVTGHPASRDVAAVLPQTIQLIAMAFVVALLVGLPVGAILSASQLLRAAAPLMQIIAAAPVFCAALAMIWLSVHVLHWPVPSQTFAPTFTGGLGGWNATLRLIALPVLAVGAAGAACVQLSLRRTATALLHAPYRAGLQMMGLRPLEIDLRYVVPQFVAGLLLCLGDIMLALLAAAAVVEWVFHREGAGVLFLKSVSSGDWNVAALILLVFATLKFTADFVGTICADMLTPLDGAA
jgi:peptide/nickel transport system permease protein